MWLAGPSDLFTAQPVRNANVQYIHATSHLGTESRGAEAKNNLDWGASPTFQTHYMALVARVQIHGRHSDHQQNRAAARQIQLTVNNDNNIFVPNSNFWLGIIEHRIAASADAYLVALGGGRGRWRRRLGRGRRG